VACSAECVSLAPDRDANRDDHAKGPTRRRRANDGRSTINTKTECVGVRPPTRTTRPNKHPHAPMMPSHLWDSNSALAALFAQSQKF
jgi:hypothetical protein